MATQVGCGYPTSVHAGGRGGLGVGHDGRIVAQSSSSAAQSSSTGGAATEQLVEPIVELQRLDSSSTASSRAAAEPVDRRPARRTASSRSCARPTTSAGSDEFVTLTNPTGADITLDANLEILGRTAIRPERHTRWTGTAGVLAAHGYFLIAGNAYSGFDNPDDFLSGGIHGRGADHLMNAPSRRPHLLRTTTARPSSTWRCFACPGMPAMNPHDDSTSPSSNSGREHRPLAARLQRLGGQLGGLRAAAPSTPKLEHDARHLSVGRRGSAQLTLDRRQRLG